MRVQALDGHQSDFPTRFSLAWTTTVSFVLLLMREPPDPMLFVPVALAALPFAAAPRHRISFRMLAAVLLVVFVGTQGLEVGSALFLPSVAALLLSTYTLSRAGADPKHRRPTRSRRR